MFNRFYQPDFDLETLEVVPNLILSDSNAATAAALDGGAVRQAAGRHGDHGRRPHRARMC